MRCVNVGMHARRGEDEAPAAARGDSLKRLVAGRIFQQGVREQDVIAHGLDAGAMELVEQVRVLLPSSRPAAFTRAKVLDRAFVYLDDDHAAGRDRLDRAPVHEIVEDRVLSRVQRAVMGPVQGEPGKRGDCVQGIEGELETEGKAGERPSVGALDHGPGAHEAFAEGGEAGVEPGQRSAASFTGHVFGTLRATPGSPALRRTMALAGPVDQEMSGGWRRQLSVGAGNARIVATPRVRDILPTTVAAH